MLNTNERPGNQGQLRPLSCVGSCVGSCATDVHSVRRGVCAGQRRCKQAQCGSHRVGRTSLAASPVARRAVRNRRVREMLARWPETRRQATGLWKQALPTCLPAPGPFVIGISIVRLRLTAAAPPREARGRLSAALRIPGWSSRSPARAAAACLTTRTTEREGRASLASMASQLFWSIGPPL